MFSLYLKFELLIQECKQCEIPSKKQRYLSFHLKQKDTAVSNSVQTINPLLEMCRVLFAFILSCYALVQGSFLIGDGIDAQDNVIFWAMDVSQNPPTFKNIYSLDSVYQNGTTSFYTGACLNGNTKQIYAVLSNFPGFYTILTFDSLSGKFVSVTDMFQLAGPL